MPGWHRAHTVPLSQCPREHKAVGKGDSEQIDTNNPAAPENRRVTIVTDVQTQ